MLDSEVRSQGRKVALTVGGIRLRSLEAEGWERPVKKMWDGEWEARLRRVVLPMPFVPGGVSLGGGG